MTVAAHVAAVSDSQTPPRAPHLTHARHEREAGDLPHELAEKGAAYASVGDQKARKRRSEDKEDEGEGEPGGEGTLRMSAARTPAVAPPTAGNAASAQPATPTAAAQPTASQPAAEPQPAEVANAEQPEGADEQAEAGSAGTND